MYVWGLVSDPYSYLQGDVFAVPYGILIRVTSRVRCADLLPAQNLVAYNGQFIYVDVSYRLGAFGFLAGQEIYKNGNLNAGLRKYSML